MGFGVGVSRALGVAVAVGQGVGIEVGKDVGVEVAATTGDGTCVGEGALIGEEGVGEVITASAGVRVRKATGVVTIGDLDSGVGWTQATPAAIRIGVKTR